MSSYDVCECPSQLDVWLFPAGSLGANAFLSPTVPCIEEPVGEFDLASSGPFSSRLHPAPSTDDKTNIAFFAVFASREKRSLPGRRRDSPISS